MFFSDDDVYKATLDYFNGDELSTSVWIKKYALKDDKDNFIERTPEDMHWRLAKEFARIESKYPNPRSAEEIFEYLREFKKIVPQGSPMAGIGNNYVYSSLSNCFAVKSPIDSMSGIFDTGKEMANLSKNRGGVGVDLSTLRPDGMSVSNAAKSSSGAWSFSEFYSNIAKMVGQSGRRAALMISMDIHHPDIEKFITMKQDLTKVTGANISVKLTDDFMEAVEKDLDFTLKFPIDSEHPKFTKTIKAKDLWSLIINSATKTAEPGILMWDNILRNLPAQEYPAYKCETTNPCCFSEKSNVYVITNSGIKEIKDVSSNDMIWVDDEKKWAKTSGYFSAGEADVYKVVFSNGEEIFITRNHKLMRKDGQLIKLSNLKVGDQIKLSINNPFASIQKTNEVELCTKIKNIEYAGVEKVGCIEVEKYHRFTANGIISGNSEIPLSPYDSCRLISLNLTGFLKNKFTEAAYFDFDEFEKCCTVGMRLSDDLVDLELERVQKIINKVDDLNEKALWLKIYDSCKNGRRTGLGTHGLADVFSGLRLRYDSDEAIKTAEKIYSTLRNSAYLESSNLSKERGAFPVFNWELEKNNAFIKRLPKEIQDKIKENGRRNISILTNAPTGSVSIVSKTSSGIEPVFKNFYTRRKKINHSEKDAHVDFVDVMGDRWQEFNVFHPAVKEWMKLNNETDESKIPEYFIESDSISWQKRVQLQGIIQLFIDHSISSTINLPKETSPEIVGQIYHNAWRNGLKGITVYVDGCRDGVLVNSKENKEKAKEPKCEFFHQDAIKRPDTLDCDIHQVSVKGEKWTILVGLLNNNPYEVFGGLSEYIEIPKKYKTGQIVKNKLPSGSRYDLKFGEDGIIKDITKVFNNATYQVHTRMISLSLRHGAKPSFLVEQLLKDPDNDLTSFSRVVARVLKKYITDGTKVGSDKICQECKQESLSYRDGCVVCLSCGWSKCS